MQTETLSPSAVEFSYGNVINFALQQNYVPAVRELLIRNETDEDWQQVTVLVDCEPNFAPSWNQTIDRVAARGSAIFKPRLAVSSRFLAELTEKLSGHYTLSIRIGLNLVFQERYQVNILAYDQWNGVNLMPEMLAAFSTPNHPSIPGILRDAATILDRWTGNPSFDGYQSRNPDRVRKQIAAIFEAIAERQLIYCGVPASFEEAGQRVRLADAIFGQRLANCLDISLLYVACLEAADIHPLLIIIKGHAFAGAWLQDSSFSDPVSDDPSLITKRMAEGINEITVIESTFMNAGSKGSFDDAVRAAEQKMQNTADFVLFIDVKRARFASIRPLPLRVATPSGWEIAMPESTSREQAAPEAIAPGPLLIDVQHIDLSKQRLWERKLLDLTLRNSLLNIRITRSVIQFMTASAGKLEDSLADGQEFLVLAKPIDWENTVRDAGLYQAIHQNDPIAELVRFELEQKRLRTYLTEAELGYSLTSLYRSSRVSLEENGANTLYVALGLLKWYETEASERPRYAPILLLPVEIIRKSAQRGYVIRSREEDTIMNITLLEMLRQDFGLNIGGLETLPRDESGVDVKLIFNIIRQAVMSRSKWDVEEQALLGNFSFNKFILWNDIHHHAAKLSRNQVVASLISGKLEWPAEEFQPGFSDESLHPSAVALPISTDSSQLQAVLGAGEGKSFVLHGPPGTGKSQTITNIIADALYSGKRVLFVAAKKAALEVVEKRLESIGIGPFCLELHSNKAKKSAVLEQLKVATEITRKNPPVNFTAEAERLLNLRRELSSLVKILHEVHNFGYSLYDLFSAWGHAPGNSRVFFPGASIASLDRQLLARWEDLVGEMQAAGLQIGSPSGHPLDGIRITQYFPAVRTEAETLIARLELLLVRLSELSAIAADLVLLGRVTLSSAQESALELLVGSLLALPDTPASMLRAEVFEQTMARVKGIAEHGQERDRLRTDLLKYFSKEILRFPADPSLSQWQIAAGKWFMPRWLGQRKISNALRSLSHSGRIRSEEVPGLLETILAYQHEADIVGAADYLPPLADFLFNSGEANWGDLQTISGQLITMNREVGHIIGATATGEWRIQIAALFREGSKVYANEHQNILSEYLQCAKETKDSLVSLSQLLAVSDGALSAGQDWKTEALKTIRSWSANLVGLPDWYNWLSVKRNAIAAGLEPLTTAYENGHVRSEDLVQDFRKSFYRSAADYILNINPELAAFSSALFEEKIRRFRELSARFRELTREELYARLAAKIPSFTQEASQSSEIGMLQRTIRNNGRAMSIRKIFDSIPNLLPRMAPCILMSPISVAQYFDAESPKFDLVIFDEASQLPTCEAVGAIARGKQLIVVGDPKQMPPTSFFSTNNIDEDNIEKEDLESILDDCLALSMPSRHLLWHYRSKHESLIAFSNAKYYENKLLTFPSTDDISSKVQLVQVKGFYDRSKTRTNEAEARAITNEVVRRLSDPELSQRTMGIVTFSSVQQSLVEDMLNEVFSLRPDLERTALESSEPLFVKNLENVQGDERDVILFSICYGPDSTGKPTLNFGPVNREGGWRRLNVAVSRARYEMMVFSTLRSEQIDLSRTASEGVAGLKAFLAYAEKGRIALPPRPATSSVDEPSLEYIIAEAIAAAGYKVDTRIGTSDFRLDIGVVDPKNSTRYILGIQTDGRNYHRSQTSGDRELVQPDVLRALGWRVHRVWSAEWWEKPERVIAGIFAAIRDAEAARGMPEPIIATPLLVAPPEDHISPLSIAFTDERDAVQIISQNPIIYKVALVEIQRGAYPDAYYYSQFDQKIAEQIMHVLQLESPVSRDVLGKRVTIAWGLNRLTARAIARLELVIQKLGTRQVDGGYNVFFWKEGQDPSTYAEYRLPANDFEKRDATDLPPEEIANGVKEVLRNQVSLLRADLVRETAKLFGYTRAGANVETAMLGGISKAIEKGYAVAQGDRVAYHAN